MATSPEPWFLLPLFYARRASGIWAEYDHATQAVALADIARRLPEGAADLDAEIRTLALDLYRKLGGPAPYFLDKTPRYHLIVSDLFRVFPDARFIFLWRNPLAVASSMLDAWGTGRWNLSYWKVDLYAGLDALVEAARVHADRVCTVRFEDLVHNSQVVADDVFDYLGIPTTADLSEPADLSGRVGDPTARQWMTPATNPLNRWRETLANPFRRRWAEGYLRWIGKGRLEQMGYDLDDLVGSLSSAQGSWTHMMSDLWLSTRGHLVDRARARLMGTTRDPRH